MKKKFSLFASLGATVLILVMTGCDALDSLTKDSNNDLSALTVSAGALTPSFNPNTHSYAVTVPNGTNSITVKATTGTTKATFSIDPAGGTITKPANNALSTVTITVTAENGDTSSYTIDVTWATGGGGEIPLPGSPSLSALTVSAGALSPAFSPTTPNYTVTVPNGTNSLQITPTSSSGTTHSINPAGPITRPIDNTPSIVTITVTGTGTPAPTTSYTIVVSWAAGGSDTPAPGSDATLNALTVSAGTLSPVFSANIKDYTLAVPSGTNSLQVTPTPQKNSAAVTITPVGTISRPANNSSTVTIVVIDGTAVNIYTIGVTWATGGGSETPAPGSDATLNALTVSAGTLSPAFSPSTPNYTVTVPIGISDIQVNATPKNSSAAVTITPVGTISRPANNSSTVTIKVTDGTVTKDYTIGVTWATSGGETPTLDATLSSLLVSDDFGSPLLLSPPFSSSNPSYALAVLSGTSGIKVNATPKNSNAAVTISLAGGGLFLSGETIPRPTNNSSTVTIKVTDGTATKDYTIGVTWLTSGGETPAPDATLNALTVSAGTLSPVFSADIKTYAVTVPIGTSGIKVNAIAKNSNAAVTISLAGGGLFLSGETIPRPVNNSSTVTIKVTDGTTTKDYTISVTWATSDGEPPTSNDATLSSLSISGGTLYPSFDPGNYSYSVTVNGFQSIHVDATPSSGAKKVITPSEYITSDIKQVIITVTAEDGFTTKDYWVSVNWDTSGGETPTSNDATLSSLSISGGTLYPSFDPGNYSYSVTVNGFQSIYVDATPSSGAKKVITPSANITSDIKQVIITVTAEDGFTTKDYWISVNWDTSGGETPTSNDATLSSLSIWGGTLSPSFDPGNYSYIVTVNDSQSIHVDATPSSGAKKVITPREDISSDIKQVIITVTAEDGFTTKDYWISVNWAASGGETPTSNDATLSSLSIWGGTLSPSFDPGNYSYIVTVNDSQSIHVDATPSSGAKKVITPREDISSDINQVTITVTAEDGITTNTYWIFVDWATSGDETPYSSRIAPR